MIKIDIEKDLISIKGHSNYEESGKDIVCASVSSMVITSVNAMMRIDLNSIDYQEDDGVIIRVLNHSEVIDLLIDNLIELLLELEKQYPKYIKLRRC